MLKNIAVQESFDLSSLENYVREKVLPGAAERDRDSTFASQIYSDLHKFGYFQAFVQKEFGGTGASLTDLACITRKLAYGASAVATTFIANMLGSGPTLLHGTRELRQRLSGESVERLSLWSFCMTEPDAGTDLMNTRTRAEKVKGGYVLQGKKCFITNANHAEHLSVFARIDGANEKAPVSAFYVPASSKGVSRGKPLKKLGQRESDTGELYFDGVFVPAENLLGNEGDGLKIAFHCLQRSKTLIAAMGLGMCDRAHDLIKTHLHQRVHYGKPLLSLPTIQCFLAQLHTESTAAWLLACQAAATWDTGDMAIKEASMAKMYAADVAARTMAELLELFGGYGFTQEFEIERLYRDVKILDIFEGATFVQQILIAKELFKDLKPKKPLAKAAA
jgi:acyl-CoA dehydrogenase